MRRFFVASLLMLFLAACRQDVQGPTDLRADLRVDPLRAGPAVATLALERAGAPVAGARVEMVANMNHAGMVPVAASFREEAPGRYRADFKWTMGGDWFVDVRGTLADGTAFERTVDVPGVEP